MIRTTELENMTDGDIEIVRTLNALKGDVREIKWYVMATAFIAAIALGKYLGIGWYA